MTMTIGCICFAMSCVCNAVQSRGTILLRLKGKLTVDVTGRPVLELGCATRKAI